MKTKFTLIQDLDAAKSINAQLVIADADKEVPREIVGHLHMQLEAALGGVARRARGFLSGTEKLPTGRNAGALGWKEELIMARSHQARMDKMAGTDPVKVRAFVAQYGLEHTPVLNNRQERRAWRRISRDL